MESMQPELDNFPQPTITPEQGAQSIADGSANALLAWTHENQMLLEEKYTSQENRVDDVTKLDIDRALIYYRAGKKEKAIESLRETSECASTQEQYDHIVDLLARIRADEAPESLDA